MSCDRSDIWIVPVFVQEKAVVWVARCLAAALRAGNAVGYPGVGVAAAAGLCRGLVQHRGERTCFWHRARLCWRVGSGCSVCSAQLNR